MLLSKNLAIALLSTLCILKSELHRSSYDLEGTIIKENKVVQAYAFLKIFVWEDRCK